MMKNTIKKIVTVTVMTAAITSSQPDPSHKVEGEKGEESHIYDMEGGQFCGLNESPEELPSDIIGTATVYNAVPKQCNADVEHTASMFKLDLKNPERHRILAVSRDLLDRYPMGSYVLMEGAGDYDGFWRIEDKLNKRYKNRIDILVANNVHLGKFKNVKLTRFK